MSPTQLAQLLDCALMGQGECSPLGTPCIVTHGRLSVEKAHEVSCPKAIVHDSSLFIEKDRRSEKLERDIVPQVCAQFSSIAEICR